MEHAVSFMDESDQIVREYRKKLWAVALEMTSSQLDQLDDIDQALHVWEPSWGTAGSSVTRPTGLVLIPLPLSPEEELSGLKRWLHANIHDFDSRNEWGGLLP
jgi:hypothetical protein